MNNKDFKKPIYFTMKKAITKKTTNNPIKTIKSSKLKKSNKDLSLFYKNKLTASDHLAILSLNILSICRAWKRNQY